MRTSSGGGYGDPLERDPQLVSKDVEDGLISSDEARAVYGVVIGGNGGRVKIAATERLRASLRKERLQERE